MARERSSDKIIIVDFKIRKNLWQSFKGLCEDQGWNMDEEVNRLIEDMITKEGVRVRPLKKSKKIRK